eukprot:CAMPEP_0194352764 /NCGR_PEP_ID=MMETSP0174-20130528/1216_1 /TAXON_ID=216777 /ORGANISM="Proboscia alata, Strain PI-D3" /LENGTH=287 /DNA_ID=CAMNT_0039121051 /DNA_START=91 /DNA_END=954 /DNA_ORIENTATION=+
MGVSAKACFAEFLGTMFFVWCGCGSAVSTQMWQSGEKDGGNLVSIALGFGFAIAALAYSIGPISGGHMNPAVSFSFLLIGKLDPLSTIAYIVSQCLGAIVGAAALYLCVSNQTDICAGELEEGALSSNICKGPRIKDADGIPGEWGPPFGLGANVAKDGLNGFFIEMIGTALLIFVVLMTAVSSKGAKSSGNAAPIAIGWAVMLAHLVMVPFTGCGINPARVLGPLVIDSFAGLNCWNKHSWVFFVAPFVGSCIVVGTFAIFETPDKESKSVEEVAKAETGTDVQVA